MSFECHNKMICAEYKKKSPNKAVVDELVNLSFAMRREDLLTTSSMCEVFTRFPFLKEEEEVHFYSRFSWILTLSCR